MSMFSNRVQKNQNLLQCVVQFFHPRSSCTTTHYIGGRSENNIKCIVHDDLGWKNRTTRYILPLHWLYEWFSQFHRCGTYSVLSRSPSIICYISNDAITKQILTAHIQQWRDWLPLVHTSVLSHEITPSDLIFPSGRKVLGKYQDFWTDVVWTEGR